MNAPTPLASSLGPALRALPPATAALLAWPLAAGPTLAARARARGLRAGVLTLSVTDAAWSDSIAAMRAELLAALALWLGPGVVSDITLEPQSPASPRRAKQSSAFRRSL